MKRFLAFVLWGTAALGCAQNSALQRPKILGIDHVDFYTTDADANDHLYSHVLGLATADPVEPGQTQRFMVGAQWVGYSPDPDPKSINRMDHVAFRTDNCAALLAYLGARGLRVPPSLSSLKDGKPSFQVKDPDGHVIEFLEAREILLQSGSPVSRRLIHAGIIVHNRAAEDHFYKDILGFHIYWYGGMKEGQTDWVAMQVPDGTDWLEYMLGISQNPDQHTTGVMNHVSLGVRNMQETQAKLESRGWKPHGHEKAQVGRDGKWQLNLYDPDFTRVELMEFKPVQKPCCSEFQGRQPTEE
jgi:catechol 2,3-dioxygenase-like lactoylglutathione lyase family enzyme